MRFTVKNRPKDATISMTEDWFEGFERKFHSIDLLTWIKENKADIIATFHLNTNENFTPSELLAFFIKKEILGE